MKQRVLRVSYVADNSGHQDIMASVKLVVLRRGKNVVVATENTEGHPFGMLIKGGKEGCNVQRAKRKSTDHKGDRGR